MSDGNPSDPRPGTGPAAKPTLPPPLKLALITVAALGLIAVLYVMWGALFHPAGPAYVAGKGEAGSSVVAVDPAAAKAEVNDKTTVSAPSLKGTGDMPPEGVFAGPDGKPVKLADFAGKVVILNFWATWCPPCLAEMPTLAKLATSLKGQPAQVVVLSVDNAKATDKAKAVIAANAPLKFYQDASGAYPFTFSPPVQTYPATYLIDKTGRIRVVAPAPKEWDSPRIRKVIDKLTAE